MSGNRQEWPGKETLPLQEVFSMTSLADSVKLLPWCISSGIPLHHMDNALAAAM